MIDLTIKTLDSQNHRFSVPDDFTVQQLKDHIADTVQVSSDSQRLIYYGRVLQNETKLSECDVNGKVIHLVQRAPPTTGDGADRIGENSSSASTNHHEPRRIDGGGAMYLGAMAFPADLMEAQGITIPQPRQGLSMGRLAIARNMLRRALLIITNLEQDYPLPANTTTGEDSPCPITPPNTATPSSTSSQHEQSANTGEDVSMEAQNAATANETGASNSDSTPLIEVELVIRHDEDMNVDDQQSIDGIGTQTEEPNRASHIPGVSDTTTRPSRIQGETDSEGRRNGRTNIMAAVLTVLSQTQRRVWPYMTAVHNILANDTNVGAGHDMSERQAQGMFDAVSEVMHNLSHAYHALSDIQCDFSLPPPRTLRCRPVLIQHSAVLHAGVLPSGRLPASVSLLRPTGVSLRLGRATSAHNTAANTNRDTNSTSTSSSTTNQPPNEVEPDLTTSSSDTSDSSSEVPAIVIEEEVVRAAHDGPEGIDYVLEFPTETIQINTIELGSSSSSSSNSPQSSAARTGPAELPADLMENMIGYLHQRVRQARHALNTTIPSASSEDRQSQTENVQQPSARETPQQLSSCETPQPQAENPQPPDPRSEQGASSVEPMECNQPQPLTESTSSSAQVSGETSRSTGRLQHRRRPTIATHMRQRLASLRQFGQTIVQPTNPLQSQPRPRSGSLSAPTSTTRSSATSDTATPSTSGTRRFAVPFSGFEVSGIGGRSFDPFLPCNSHHIQANGRSRNSVLRANAAAANLESSTSSSATQTQQQQQAQRQEQGTQSEESTARRQQSQAVPQQESLRTEPTPSQEPSASQQQQQQQPRLRVIPNLSPPPHFMQFVNSLVANHLGDIMSGAIPGMENITFGPRTAGDGQASGSNVTGATDRNSTSSTRRPRARIQVLAQPLPDVFQFQIGPDTSLQQIAAAAVAAAADAAADVAAGMTSGRQQSEGNSGQNISENPIGLRTTVDEATDDGIDVGDDILDDDDDIDETVLIEADIEVGDDAARVLVGGLGEPSDVEIEGQGGEMQQVGVGSTSTSGSQLTGVPLYEEQLGSLFMDMIRGVLQSLPFQRIQMYSSDSRILHSFRTIMCRFIDSHFPGGFRHPSVTSAINRLFNNQLALMRNQLEVPQVRAGIDIISTLCRFNHMRVPDLLAFIVSSESDEVFAARFPTMVSEFTKQLAAIFAFCLNNNIDSLTKLLNSIVSVCGLELLNDKDFIKWLREQLPALAISLASSQDIPNSIQQYLVYRLPEPGTSVPAENAVQPSPMEIDEDDSGSPKIEPKNGSPKKEDTSSPEPLPNVVIGSEDWHNAVPPDWVPIITRDVQRLRRQGSQPPFSDAYLSGMPRKRRKLVSNSRSEVSNSVDMAMADSTVGNNTSENVQSASTAERANTSARARGSERKRSSSGKYCKK